MNLNNETSIKDIQKEFNNKYPSLWIEFTCKPDAKKNFLSNTNNVNPEMKIKDLKSFYVLEPIDISGERTISEIKMDFNKKFGLQAKILRKSGNLWIGTSLTEDWTLAYQNSEGAQIDFSNEIHLPEF
jgi:hypothetical protein